KLTLFERLKAEFPLGVVTLLSIPGIGPKKAYQLATELTITTVDELEEAIHSGRVAALPRMGEKTADNILQQIIAFRRKDQRIPIGEATPIVDEILAGLRHLPGLKNISPAGSLRRFRETIGDIDIMGTADDGEELMGAFIALPVVSQVIASGVTRASVIVAGGLQVDLRIVTHDRYGSSLQYFTGSKQHNIDLRERARKQGLSLSEYGIAVLDTGKLEQYANEEAFYNRLELQYIPPEIREGGTEIEKAANHALPELIKQADIKGDTHVHTDWSDGRDSLEKMALAARELGYEYIVITDHSAGRGVAHGLNSERLHQQAAEIREINGRLDDIRLLSGVEVDIRADGSLDTPDEALAELDVVVASVHSGLTEDREKMTGRIIRAMENPNVDIIGHPTCRLLGEREPVAADMEAIFQAAARTGAALEINSLPSRLDLKDIHVHRARELGVKLVMGTDSHKEDHLGFMRFGIGTARRGWCRTADVLNTMPLIKFLQALVKAG
ncbi:DNA polymerase/3'-5' exonuclease PolX, partial [Chloroflexota bacterium]